MSASQKVPIPSPTDHAGEMPESIGVAVIGGGPAGLQAALTLGRMHVETVLFDDGQYRNAKSAGLGNVLGWDDASPEDLRAEGRAALTRFPWVRVVEEAVLAAEPLEVGQVLRTEDSAWIAERLLIATGVRDALLPIPGARELWGDVVLPCPYCHGHEFAKGPIAVISSGAHADHVGSLLRGISASVPVLSPDEVTRIGRSESGVTVWLSDGSAIDAACAFIPPNPVAWSPIAEALGVTGDETGIEVDTLGRTSRPGVWAAGDVARRADTRTPQAVVTSMAAGLIAAADIAADVGKDRDRAGGGDVVGSNRTGTAR